MKGDVSYTETLVGRGQTAFGAEATYTCNNSYALQGRSSRECLYNAMWSGSAPVCGEVSYNFVCPRDLRVPANGSVTVNAETHYMGTVAMYTCNTGLYLVGEGVRVCLSDGTWSGTEPTCRGEHLFHCAFTFLLDSTR